MTSNTLAPHTERLAIEKVDNKANMAVVAMEQYLNDTSMDHTIRELIKIRVSQINGCAYCLEMHMKDARKLGIDQTKLDIVSAWYEAPNFFDEREKSALALAEAVTKLGEHGVSDDVWNAAADNYSEAELVQLLIAIGAINVWNRLAIATRKHIPSDPADN